MKANRSIQLSSAIPWVPALTKALLAWALVIPVASVEAAEGFDGPSGVRIAAAVGGFHDVWQYSALYEFSAPARLTAHRMELAVGALASREDTRPFISYGPVWRFTPMRSVYLELGFSPTVLAGSTLDGRDLGGNFHFTSAATLGTYFGVQGKYALALRIQHTSNGGLNSVNPGLDAVALNFTFDL